MFGIKFAPATAADAGVRDQHPRRDHRFDQDELRHLLATAGGLTWGITSGRPGKCSSAARSHDGCQPAA